MHPQRIILIIFSMLGAFTTFLPHAEISYYGSVDGTNLFGWLTFVLFIGVIIFCVWGKRGDFMISWQRNAIFLLSGIILGIAIFNLINIRQLSKEVIENHPFAKISGTDLSISYGLYLLLAIPFVNFAVLIFFNRD